NIGVGNSKLTCLLNNHALNLGVERYRTFYHIIKSTGHYRTEFKIRRLLDHLLKNVVFRFSHRVGRIAELNSAIVAVKSGKKWECNLIKKVNSRLKRIAMSIHNITNLRRVAASHTYL